jgi:nitroimidazol reductase NimA-like FMN-containing flavoprotein (pyridoxamine 5'-phosphate oxidase superfamily)
MEHSETDWPEVHLEEVETDECWRLIIETDQIARVAWNSGSGPVALPVNFVVHEGSVWVRTSAYSSLAREIDDTHIAVEVDEIDPATHLGWSVLVRGVAEVRYHPAEVPAVVREHHSWPAGPRPLWVQLTPYELTGRRLAAG